MDSNEAERCINRSQHILAHYKAMISAGNLPQSDGNLFQDEVALLEHVAATNPSKTVRVARLISEWLRMAVGLVERRN